MQAGVLADKVNSFPKVKYACTERRRVVSVNVTN